MTTLSTHVLDASTGTPAEGLEVVLHGPDGAVLVTASTGPDGRARLVGPPSGGGGGGADPGSAPPAAPAPAALAPGDHRLVFATGAWSAARGRPCFYPEVSISFTAAAGDAHLHVPLLLSPYAFSTYRGS